jgi:hypothetical protein
MSRAPAPSAAYQSLIAQQPSLADRAQEISNKFGEFYHLVQEINQHMHAVPPLPQETQAYNNFCIQINRTLTEQEGILRAWQKLAHVQAV